MTGPNNIKLPFYAYGVFRKGELGYLSISDLVDRVVEPVFVRGSLLLRDGLPIVDPQSDASVSGSLIYFKEGCESEEAYERTNRQRLVKTGGRLVKHARYYWLLLAEGHLTRRVFGALRRPILALPMPAG